MRRLGQLDARVVCGLDLDEVDVTENVLAVRVLVAVAFRQGTGASLAPMDQAHDWIKQLRGRRRSSSGR